MAAPRKSVHLKARVALAAMVPMLCIAPAAAPVAAQDDSEQLDRRLDKLEGEMRAVQRKVFPGGGQDRFFSPEILPEVNPSTRTQQGSDIGTDLLVRVEAVENQLTTLTGQIEMMQNRLRMLEESVSNGAVATPANGDTGAYQPSADPYDPNASGPDATGTSTTIPSTSVTPAVTQPATTTPVSTEPDPSRVAAVAAIERPNTGDAFDDSYSYGFRLWNAGFYPEAQIQLQKTVDDYPTNPRISWARNLLGRAWLDDGKPSQAAPILLGNYQKDRNGERAADSLVYLTVAMENLGRPDKACEVLKELDEVYPDIVAGRLSDEVSIVRQRVACN